MTTTESNTKPSSALIKRRLTQNEVAKRLKKVLTKGVPVYSACKLTKNHIESLYLIAYNFYVEGKYGKAAQIFQIMAFLNHLDKRGWMGLAASFQMLKSYQAAVATYYYAGILDMSDPKPALYSADCYIALNNYPQAIKALEIAVLFSGDNPQYAELKKKAEGVRDALAQTVKAP